MNKMHCAAVSASAALLLAAGTACAASNPEVVPPGCAKTVVEECVGVTAPTGGVVTADGSCSNFTFRLAGVISGFERVSRTEVWTGDASCLEPKRLSEDVTPLLPRISWFAPGGYATNTSDGIIVEVPRTNGACSAACTFTVACEPSICDSPSPVVLSAEAVFEDAVGIAERGRPRLCCVSTNHAPHVFAKSGCDWPTMRIDPQNAADVVWQNREEAHVLGLGAGSALAVAKAPCGAGSNTFDVVTIGDFSVSGMCGCFSATDSTDDDSDAPTVETMDLGGGRTGYSLSLEASGWLDDTCWRINGGDWMPNAGSFGGGVQQAFAGADAASESTIDAWFDCDPDCERAQDEPKRRVVGTLARLGELTAVGDAERRKGDPLADDETFAPGEAVLFRNTGILPAGREHQLKVIAKMASDKSCAMTLPLGLVPSADAPNTWTLKIPEDCCVGSFTVELVDLEHSCTSLRKTYSVRGCACSSCDEFSKVVLANGCIDVSFGLGRTSSGGAKAPVRFVLHETGSLPELTSVSAPDGTMDVSTSNGVMSVSFVRTGEHAPCAAVTLTPGAEGFVLRETRDGSLRKTARWTLAGGVWTMEVWDETAVPAQIVSRDMRTSRETARGTAETLSKGGETVETEYEEVPGIGQMPVRETRGVGAEARTTWRAYVESGPATGRVRSELMPDGSWTMSAYDAAGRLSSAMSPFGDCAPIVDDRNAVIGYNGVVRRTVYSYGPVDPRDAGTLLADEPRAVVVYIGSDASGWTEVSRRYSAHFVEGGVRFEVFERAASPGATYGAAGGQRTTSSYLWSCRGAGRPVRRETPDGLVSLWSYDFTPSNVVIEAVSVPASATNGVPFKTTVARTVEDLRGDVLREETYVVTDSGRELLAWTDFERDAAGHELRRESSDGSLVERAWSCCGPEWEMDERGIVTVYSYDALGRQSTMTRSGVTTLRNYDLAGNATNVTRFADALMASSSTGYDSAGRLAWNIGEDGIRTEYAYSTSTDGGEVRTTIQAAGTNCAVTNTVVSFRDGETKATYLNNVLKTTEIHESFVSATYEGTNGLASARWSRIETDFLGLSLSESRPGFGGSTLVTSNLYDTAGRLASSESMVLGSENIKLQTSNVKLYLYDNLNDRIATVADRNFNNAIDWAGPDLVSSNSTHYVKLDGDWWRETKSYSIHDDNSAVARLMGVRLSRVTGLGANGLASETISIDQRGNATTNRLFRNRVAAEDIAWVKHPTSTTPAVTVSTNGLMMSSTSQTGVTTTFAYDAFQREVSQTDGRGNTTRTVYDNLGRVSSTIDALGYATAYGYDALGRQISVTDPLTNTVYTAYDSEGHVVSQRGATYPVDYSYDEFGDKVSMTTYRDLVGRGDPTAPQGDVTRWLRDEATGLVTNKVYADGKGPRYDYTPDGRLATRTWARGIVTTYSYDDNGSLTNTVYSDGTPTISLAYNRAGRQIEAHDAAGITTFLYDDFGSLTNETVIGVAGTNTIERFYDTFGRDAGYSLNGVRQSTLAYDPATGRLATMQIPSEQSNNPNNQTIKQFTWSYHPGSDLKSSLAYPNGLTASWTYDANNQLLQVKNAFPTNVISQYDYTCDAAGRRVQIARSGTAMSETRTDVYGCNARSELVSGAKLGGPGSVPAVTEYSYQYDDIGNRITSLDLGTNRVYSANELNQYSSITTLTSDAGLQNSSFEPQFDLDGNQTLIQTSTGVWQVQYNGENRPVLWTCLQSNNQTITTNQTISMLFDRMGRRVEYVETTGGPGFVPATTNVHHRFVYDGYLCIQRLDATANNLVELSFAWDPTEPIATRPLVMQRNGGWNFFYTHDGNKNVSDVVSFQQARGVPAHYEYAPFGAVTAVVRNNAITAFNVAATNPFRFSSEYADDTLGLVYYNYRHYDPVAGRWSQRDFIEVGNPYGFMDNSVEQHADGLGLFKYDLDLERCKFKMTLKWKVVFDEKTPFVINVWENKMAPAVKWKWADKEDWKNAASAAVHDYFNGISQKCVPTANQCCKCRNGVSVDVGIEYVETGYDYLVVVVGYAGYRFQSNTSTEKKKSSLDRSAPYWTASHDYRKNASNPDEIHIALIHEVGHMLGLKHPGQTLPLDKLPNGIRPRQYSFLDYEVDYKSLMGRGMELRDYDFKKAFCDKIDWSKCKRPWYKFW